MNTMPYSAEHPEQWDDEPDAPLMAPGRPRRHFWGPATSVLLALLVGGIGFYVGIRVEKGQTSSSTSGLSAFASRFAAGSGATTASSRRGTGTGTGATSSAAGAATGAAAGGAGAAPGAGFGRFAGGTGGGNSSFGTVSSVAGKALYITDTTGNTVKVMLSSATALTKSLGVSAASLHPGDTVIVQGVKGSNGTIAATSVSDSGNRSATSAVSSSSSGSSSSGSAAVSSLFGSGG